MFHYSSPTRALLLCFILYTLLISSAQSLHTPRDFLSHSHHAVHQHHSASHEIAPSPVANPELAMTIPIAGIEDLGQDLKHARNIEDAPISGRSSPVNNIEKREPIHRRQNITQSVLESARAVVKAAHVDIGAQNAHIRANPRLNNYTFRNKTSTLKTRSDSFVVNSTLAEAAAIVAEADAAAKASNGTLYKTYQLPAGFKSPPGHETGGYQNHTSARSTGNLPKRADSFWMETVGAEYAGSYPLDTTESNYKVWRNVKDYGAVGDGKTDDTAAINKAISDGNRCGDGCSSTSAKGAVVYFPSGTYLVSTSIVAYYNTQLIGNPNNMPIIKAAPSFIGLGVISSDVYLASGEWYVDTDNFFRAVRNFIVDITDATVKAPACVHWQVAQATSLQNMYFWMVDDASRAQVGVFAENGSGGFMSDLVFKTGSIGLQCGNQQFTTRAMQFIQCTTAISLLWDWGWTFKSLDIFGSKYGITIAGDTVGGSVYLLDSLITSTGVGIAMPSTSSDLLTTNYLNIDNLVVKDTPTAVTQGGTTILSAGDTTINSWVYGRVYDADNPSGKISKGTALANPHPMTASLGGGPNGGYFERSRPQYETLAADAFVNAKRWASGDGKHDDTNALNTAFSVAASEGLAVYVPAGTYMVTGTVHIPSGSVIIGECWSQIMATGKYFQDMNNPQVMVQVGVSGGETGTVEIQDLLFTVQGPTAGAVLVEWNIKASAAGKAAMWDSHFRVGGALGSDLQLADCPKLTGSINPKCIASSLMLHLTNVGSAYLENIWAWTADHDMDDQAQTQIDIYSARGILIESLGPTWLYGTASEHSVLYQYQLYQAQDVFMSMIQTESPYYPPAPKAPAPFTNVVGYYESDPDITGDCDGISNVGCFQSWALNIVSSTNVQIGGAGLYSWFIGYNEDCVNTQNCQLRLVSTEANSDLYILNLYTIGSTQMIVPTGSNLTTALAVDNTNENAYPWLAVISAWTDLDSGGDGTWIEFCQWDDDHPECNTNNPGICDLTLTFASLDALQAASGSFPSYCLDIYTLQVVGDMLPAAIANYTSVDNHYDEKFGYYVQYVKDLVPKQLSAFMASGGPGNAFFECTYNAGDGKGNHTTQACPIEVSALETFYTIYYTPTNLTGFYDALLATYGIDSTWVKLGESVDALSCPNQRCEPYSHTLEGFPLPADKIDVPNPKDIVTAALPNITSLQTNIQATRWDMLLGQWQGSNDDVVQVVSTPIFMIQQAIDSMSTVKDIGQDQEDNDKKALILEILSIVFVFIPFVGEAVGAFADVSVQLVRMISLISAVGNEALSIVDIVNDPSSAPMAILGILLGATDFRNPDSFAKMATARRDMTSDDILKVGTLFKGNNDKLEALVKACSK